MCAIIALILRIPSIVTVGSHRVKGGSGNRALDNLPGRFQTEPSHPIFAISERLSHVTRGDGVSVYCQRGTVPAKRHSQHRRPDGQLLHEELFSAQGFSGISSLLYHLVPPTRATSYQMLPSVEIKECPPDVLRPHMFDTTRVARSGDAVSGRVPLVFNSRSVVSFVAPDAAMEYFARNAICDELALIVGGTGALLSPFGRLEFGPGDMIVVPRGTTTRWVTDSDVQTRMLVFESTDPIEIPAHLRSMSGQLLEKSPFCERDLRAPAWQEPATETGEFPVRVKSGSAVTEVILEGHPFDVVGWDGCLYPFALNVKEVEPITGSLHQMPDRYQVLGTVGAAICVVGPHKLDYHPNAVPSPPNHINLDSDELMFTLSGTVPGRTQSGSGQLTFHPRGLHHGPNTGGYERSIGLEETDLTAFMIDTFQALSLTTDALDCDDESYTNRWVG